MSREPIELQFAWRGLRLSGGLHLPDGAGPHPAVLMLQGSGPSDRDNDGYFPPLRDGLVTRGVAAYAFDKPGTGKSDGDWRDFGLIDRAEQADEALAALRDCTEIDARRVGVFGHSQGGWLVQMLAARRDDLAFAITSSGPSIAPGLQDRYGCEHTMRAAGHSEAGIQQALDFLDQVHAAARAGESYESFERRVLADARQQSWYGYLDIADARTWNLFLRFARDEFEPREALARIQCPFLGVFGGRDNLVPAWQSARECGQALDRAGNQDSTVIVFPSGNHRMHDTGGALVPGFVDLLGSWTASRAGVVDRR